MAVNNYQRLVDMVEQIGYHGYFYLWFKIRKKDIENLPENKKFGKNIVRLEEIDMNTVKSICNENLARCYISFLDEKFYKFVDILGHNYERTQECLTCDHFDEIGGLRLIDLDGNSEECREVSDWLINNGARNIYVFPSKTGFSILFYSEGKDFVNRYLQTEYSKRFGLHGLGILNLYIPDF